MKKAAAQRLARQIFNDDPMTKATVEVFRQVDPSDGSGINDAVSYRVYILDYRCGYNTWLRDAAEWAERLAAIRAYEATVA